MKRKKQTYHDLPVSKVLGFLRRYDSFALLDSSLCDSENYLSVICFDLLERIQVENPSKVKDAINRAEKIVATGHYAICVFPYEAGFALEPAWFYHENLPYPCVFLFFKQNVFFDHKSGKFSENAPDGFLLGNVNTNWGMNRLWFDTHYNEYRKKIKKIKHFIEQGETYQVNYTIRCWFEFYGSVYGMYMNLRRMQPVPYSALIKDGKGFILSFSPELFFKKTGNKIKTMPMKGTIGRGSNESEDKKNAEILKKSIKDRAENIMIVDMMRNDLGRICNSGSIVVEPLFHIEKYRTLFQMTSTVSGQLKENVSLYEIFKSLFPSASVTGAPKIRTMQIISELEKNPRKIYTGSIGFISPERNCVFNVAIRTIMIDGKKGMMGTGGGIVYDSVPHKEYKECLLKAMFLVNSTKKMALIETMLYTGRDYFLFDLHMKRLSKSAKFFRFSFSIKKITNELKKLTDSFEVNTIYRVKLLLFPDGKVSLSFQPAEKTSGIQKSAFSRRKIDPENIFLYHKTTVRKIYDDCYRKARKAGYFDIIFQNTKGEITEGCISNVFIEKSGILYTPAVKSGLLPGVLREHLIREGKVEEKVITEKELLNADRIFLGNSVRGLVEVEISP